MISFEFIYPWLLLLLIPAFLITLLPHFKLVKRFRRTRNRIIPLVMRMIVFVLAITTLAGITISYTLPNKGNEVILLVDVSDGITNRYQNVREDCISNIVYGMENDLEGAKLGIVTFGYDQKYVAPINASVSEAYDQYMMADEVPDTSATNIAAALNFAKGLFTEEATWKKIILITDGQETDEVALKVIRQMIAEDDKLFVDVVDLQAQYEGSDAQVVGVLMPEYRVVSGQECEIKISVQSNAAGMVLNLTLYDNEILSDANGAKGYQEFVSNGSVQEISFRHVFAEGGLHTLKAVLTEDESDYDKNNTYISYYNIEVFDDLLIIEGVEHDSDVLKDILSQEDATPDGKYHVTVLSIPTLTAEVATPIFTIDALRQYDQIILNNVSNADLLKIDQILYEGQYPQPTETDPTLDQFKNTTIGLLYDYVHEYGGGLFTIGGDDLTGTQHAYDIEDLKFTTYSQMLPVQVVDYTPPTGVVIIIDRSGSMDGEKLSAARQGAYAVLEALTERDYLCIMTLDDTYYTVLEMTSVRFKDKIRAAIDSVDKATGGTIFANAIQRAGQTLAAMNYVQKRHIIMITDGEPGDKESDYLPFVKQFYQNNGTTVSVAIVGGAGPKAQAICDAAGGEAKGSYVYAVTNTDLFAEKLRGDIANPSIKELVPEEFNPNITSMLSPLTSGFDTLEEHPNKMIATLGGFYGVKARSAESGSEVVLTANYDVPLYAQWGFGNGRVGSFMSDLKGTSDSWSENFLADKDGIKFILNVISNLMPTSSIRPSELSYAFTEDNYTNTITIYNTFEKGEYVTGNIYSVAADGTESLVLSLNQKVGEEVNLSEEKCYVNINFTQNAEETNSLYCSFVFKMSGVYRVDLVKHDAAGLPTDVTASFYKDFAYSEEYDIFVDEEAAEQLKEDLVTLAERGRGGYVTDIDDTSVLLNAEDTIVKVYDPRTLFMILTIIMMLIDIAVRKFKFKWPHEIIRDRRQQKKLAGKK